MKNHTIAGYGSWKSPITSDLVLSASIRFDGQVETDRGDLYWVEMRPTDAGRSVLVRRTRAGQTADVTSKPYSVRTRVYELGRGSYKIEDGTVYFSNLADQRIYRQTAGSPPSAITAESRKRFADGTIDRRRRRMICVCEDQAQDDREPQNYLAAIDLDGMGNIRKLVFGNDFYSAPRVSPDGSQLAWLTWNHPNMPWDCTELWIGQIKEDGSIGRRFMVAGGSDDTICQPRFSPDGKLYFLSEKTGWLNLYRWTDGYAQALCPMEAEFGAASSVSVFAYQTYAFESPKRMVCTYVKDCFSHLATLDTETLRFEEINIPYTHISTVQAAPGSAIILAGSPTEPISLVKLDLATGKAEILRRSTDVTVDPGHVSVPESIAFPTEGGVISHALYYSPKNSSFVAPEAERPPLIVVNHGGPTLATSSSMNLAFQFWTSRGFAVADVDYGGSTGYGRSYRQRVNGRLGIVDVDDCANCARYLIDRGEVDRTRTIVRGVSAGGYTTLAALTFRDIFRAGASYYGVSDLEALTKDPRKFVSRYVERTVGPYPSRRDLYLERSPIHHVDRLSCPVIFFQGDQDRIVPQDQAERMANALRRKGVPVAYVLFQGEGHGFIKPGNIKRSLDAELYFYSRVFGFEPADTLDPVQIDNLP